MSSHLENRLEYVPVAVAKESLLRFHVKLLRTKKNYRTDDRIERSRLYVEAALDDHIQLMVVFCFYHNFAIIQLKE